MMGRAQGDNEEEAMHETTTEWLTGRIPSEKPVRFQWRRKAWSMAPWIIAAPLGKTERKLPKVNSTSYLNGLRGVACLIVFNYHVAILWNPMQKKTLGKVPLFNVGLAGHGATMVFFVLSGFVLSYSPLSKISSGGNDSALLTSLWSSIIRRGFRLFTPLVALAFMFAFVTFFTSMYEDSKQLPYAQTDPKTVADFFLNMESYARMVLRLINPFTWKIVQPATLEQAWTLPFEYRGSLIVFLLCIVCSRLTSRCRKLFLLAFALFALHYVRWDVFCFTAGMGLAELRFCPLFESQPEALPRSAADVPARPWARLARHVKVRSVRSAVALLTLVPAVVVCAWPESGATLGVEPYASIHATFTPAQYSGNDIDFLYASVGAVGVLASLESLPSFQWLLSTAPFRYLGEISFAFYLMHLLLITTVSAPTFLFLMDVLGWSFQPSYVVVWILAAAGTCITADWFWRAVDETSVRMSRKISDWVIAKPKDTEPAYHAL
ncbi:hypothetical protein J7T55_003544 [Diaporthe amygdali]|uniref:uncharacterized protein n=1 Tax=Phomopsis amygdali TaxID=1214568 RepID=UPI0022FDF162|nr:uncharacterized protein J7T55_003544 [Diaporthe amygdali]KAJ0117127.1 hypothetical protein J7T55_003544 [Diaporthe amygdali]